MFKGTASYFNLYINILILFALFYCIESGLNNLHTIDGTSTAEIIAGDVFFEIVEPDELQYTYRLRPAKDFGAPFNESFRLKNVPLVPVVPNFACDTPANSDDIEGNVALIQRGECSFKTKTIIAERAGARAVIITDTSKSNEDYFIEMIDDESTDETHIPAGFLMGKNGLMITKTLERLGRDYALITIPVNLTFTPIHNMNQPPWLGW